uniref:Ligand-binding protein SH3 n=1 Tax=Candidatus Methanomethylicus mesodigestus TaxID=1867258 RepID=A0A7C3ITD3_9CREN
MAEFEFAQLLYVFLLAMYPVVECRGAIPFGIIAGGDPVAVFAASFIGNMLPIPFLLLLIGRIEEWIMSFKEGNAVRRWYVRYIRRIRESAKPKIERYGFWGLMLFVAVPLPLTGAWTASLVASLFGIRLSRALIAITAGVLVACVIVTALVLGLGLVL